MVKRNGANRTTRLSNAMHTVLWVQAAGFHMATKRDAQMRPLENNDESTKILSKDMYIDEDVSILIMLLSNFSKNVFPSGIPETLSGIKYWM